LIFGIRDFDVPGIKNVLRPHVEHLSAFLYGTDRNETVAAIEGKSLEEFDAEVLFDHLALTPAMALGLVEDEADRERIMAYIASGGNLWDRDLARLDGVQKIETEALDPVQLRDLVVEAIEEVIDTEALKHLVSEQESERERLSSGLLELGRAFDRDRP
jgi:hypothetical protein